jgi:phosphatidylglycerophosphate synthase
MTTVTAPARPGAAQFRARNRGGGLFTETVNQRIGSHLAVAAERLGLPPTALTLANLVLGLAGAILVGALAGPMRSGSVPHLVVGLIGLVIWQLAYSFDCADGQLARVTGRASPAGGRADVLCDVALQIALVAAVATVGHAYRPGMPDWLVAAFAGAWMVNVIASELQKGGAAQSLITSGSPVIRVVKLVRDYGAVVTVVALVIAFVPQWTVWLMVLFTVINGLFLAASIVAAARSSWSAAPAAGNLPDSGGTQR